MTNPEQPRRPPEDNRTASQAARSNSTRGRNRAGESPATALTRSPDGRPFITLIEQGIAEADASGTEISLLVAQAIASAITEQAPDKSPALTAFAVTGDVNLAAMAVETRTLHDAPHTPDQTKIWIRRLGDHLASRLDDPAYAPPFALEPGDIDFTGTVPQPTEMRDLIHDGFLEVEAHGGEMPDWSARAIARLLADGSNDPASALHQFAVTGRGDPDAISAETIPLYIRPDTPAEVRQWIDYLGTYLLHQQDQMAPTGLAEPTRLRTPQEIEGIRLHGNAFIAYLSLPDIDPDRKDLLQTFAEVYVGTYTSINHLIDELTEITDWQAALDKVSDQWGIEDLVTLNRAKIERLVRDRWDIVQINNQLFAFEK